MRNYPADRSIQIYMKMPGMLFVAGLLAAQGGMAQQATPTAAGSASPLIRGRRNRAQHFRLERYRRASAGLRCAS